MNEFNKYFSKCGLIGELPEKKFNRPTFEEVIIWDLAFNRALTRNIWRVLHGLKPLNPKLSNIKTTSFKTYDWEDAFADVLAGLYKKEFARQKKLSNIKTTSFKVYDWEQFWCKASWLVIGITLGLVVAMIL